MNESADDFMGIDTFEDWYMWKKTDAREETELYVYFRFI